MPGSSTTSGDIADSPRASVGPYVGPRPFHQSEADRFFGRHLETRDVVSLWLGDRITILHGPPTVGKTSLLQAGVLPLVSRRANVDLLPVGGVGRQSARPAATRAPINDYSYELIGHWAQRGSPPQPRTSIAEFLLARTQHMSEHMSEQSGPYSLLAAIDQFEMLFAGFPARQAERDKFIDELTEALRSLPTLKLLLIIGDDHLATLSSHEHRFGPHRFNYVRLGALSQGAASEALRRPLAGTGRAFGPGVAEELVNQLRTVVYTGLTGESATIRNDSVQPLLLQIVATHLWSSLPVGLRTITSSEIRASSDIDQVLAHFYDSAIRATQVETGVPEPELRSWVEATFITERGTRGTADRGLLMTANMTNEVADALERRHVLIAENHAWSTLYQLSQDGMVGAIRRANRNWRAGHKLEFLPVAAPATSATSATPEAMLTSAEAALAEGDFPDAHRFAQTAMISYQRSGDTRRLAQALMVQAGIASDEGDLDAAEGHLNDALSAFALLEDRQSTVRVLSMLADIHFRAGNYRLAADFRRQAVDRLPTDVDALIGLGYALWYAGSPADAEATFAQAITSDAASASAFGGRGQVRAEMREYDTALPDLDGALSLGLSPVEEVDARSARALALVGLGRQEEADRELATARIQDPDRARTLRRVARIAEIRDQRDLALAEAKRALHASPPLPPWDESDARRLVTNLSDHGG